MLAEVKRAEDRRGQLQQRVAIIEELRRGQSVPVQMLDHVSRSMPDLLWLTALEQKADDVTIEGRTTTLISLADFVANLGTNKLVEKPIDIVNSQVGTAQRADAGRAELIKFSVKAPLSKPAPEGASDGRQRPAQRRRRRAKAVCLTARLRKNENMAINLSLSKMPWYGQVAAFAVLGLGAAGAFWNWYAQGAQQAIEAQRAQLTSLHAEIDRGHAAEKRLPEFRRELASLEAQMSRLRAVLPDERDVADLLRRVQGMATQSSLTILGFTPQAVTKKTMYVEWPIGLKLEGTYHDLGLFLERVSKFPRIINVGNLKVKALDKSRQRRDDHGGIARPRRSSSSSSRRAQAGDAGCASAPGAPAAAPAAKMTE